METNLAFQVQEVPFLGGTKDVTKVPPYHHVSPSALLLLLLHVSFSENDDLKLKRKGREPFLKIFDPRLSLRQK